MICIELVHNLQKICNNSDVPFGGMNVIFAGDFGQLPPAMGGESCALYCGNIGSMIKSSLTHYGQEAAIGKALWHQVTTMVILRENMRQKTQSEQNNRLRKALENMCFQNCIAANVKFRNVSIITAWNSQKDRINELGCTRFAADTGQDLISFFSEDMWLQNDGMIREINGKRRHTTKFSYILSEDVQKILWSQSLHTSEHFASKLYLCIGMPVIIRHNDATKLCITNGQEGIVAGWTSSTGSLGQIILETLFVQLVQPPAEISLEHLPLNVVPIPFHNVVDLQHCQFHQSYYTALSRSASADGTAIIQGFDPSKIIGGASG
ncbi:hypothetical protein PAXINDRAFT_164180 [Paxillus involutus ATCC 200175]|uniref:ATP-dependent DNA helicase n=1 Tax=Paxillus involutus ATCC 200175 TaxID=664439 RepID=A0A0C9TT54_PAXIN|nr:hypothetical protein PAXINDRAFT_164180 [Paxillus involutus ATCC 200175]